LHISLILTPDDAIEVHATMERQSRSGVWPA
jgi:hypothetical protein